MIQVLAQIHLQSWCLCLHHLFRQIISDSKKPLVKTDLLRLVLHAQFIFTFLISSLWEMFATIYTFKAHHNSLYDSIRAPFTLLLSKENKPSQFISHLKQMLHPRKHPAEPLQCNHVLPIVWWPGLLHHTSTMASPLFYQAVHSLSAPIFSASANEGKYPVLILHHLVCLCWRFHWSCLFFFTQPIHIQPSTKQQGRINQE